MNRVMRCAARVLSVFVLLAIPSVVFSKNGYTPAFYVFMTTGEKTELVKFKNQDDTDPEKIADIETGELLLPIEEVMPEVEVKAFQDDVKNDRLRYPAAIEEQGISNWLKGLWVLSADEFLLHRNYVFCFMPDEPCYGYTEFSLLNATTDTESVLWSLPYHEKMFDDRPCYQDAFYENYSGIQLVQDVQIHPTRDLVAIVINDLLCPGFTLLIDYGAETSSIQTLENILAMSWSPDGTEMAYIETSERLEYKYGRMALDTGLKTVFQERALVEELWINWLNADTIIYRYASPDLDDLDSIVWHTLSDHSEVVKPLPFDQIPDEAFRVSDGKTSVLYSKTWFDGETLGINTLLKEDPLDIRQSPHHVSDPGSRNRKYIPAVRCLDEANNYYRCDESEFGLLDVNGVFLPLDLDNIRQEYKADHIRFAAVAVQQP